MSTKLLNKIPKFLSYGVSILIFGLIIHFIGINFLQFVVGIGKPWISVLALWKEIMIFLLIIWVIYYNIASYGFKGWLRILKKDTYFMRLLKGFWIIIAVTLIASAFSSSLGHYIIAFRYDFIWVVLLLLAYQIAKIIPATEIKKITKTYLQIIKWLVWIGLIRYFVISSIPWALKLVGYDKNVYEWALGEKPPAVYYAALDHGAPRNQFLWERPIFYGFYLIAFWPFFFLLYLRKASKSEAIFFWILYVLNIFSTFSRSAWWVWILETTLLAALLYGKFALKYLKYILIPVVGLGALVGRKFYYEIFGSGRSFSNTGHINAFYESLEILKTTWISWLGAWSAGPASHQLGIGFNPENQYLQIWIEYGIFGFLARLVGYVYLTVNGFIRGGWNKARTYFQDTQVLHRDNQRLVLLSCNIWLLALAICGLVLHSLADKMVIRPLMLFYGLWLGYSAPKKD